MRLAALPPFLLLAGCASAALPETTFEPPETCAFDDDACFLRIADAFARHVMGERYAARHLSEPTLTREPLHDFCVEDPSSCSFDAPLAHVVYRFRAEGAPWVDELAEIVIATDDSSIHDAGGLPDCSAAPAECSFPLDEATVRDLARRAGLGEGIAPWETSFHYYHGEERRLRTYAWSVANTTSGGAGGNGEGDAYLFDANTGRLLLRSGWARIVD